MICSHPALQLQTTSSHSLPYGKLQTGMKPSQRKTKLCSQYYFDLLKTRLIVWQRSKPIHRDLVCFRFVIFLSSQTKPPVKLFRM